MTRLRWGAGGLNAAGIVRVAAMQTRLVEELPNSQETSQPMPDALPIFDARAKSVQEATSTLKKQAQAEDAPISEINGVNYSNMTKMGSFYYRVDDDTKVAGLSDFGNGLYVQPNPVKLYEKVGQENMEAVKVEIKDKAQYGVMVSSFANEAGARDYRESCIRAISGDHPSKPVTIVVLGPQHGNSHQNGEGYYELCSQDNNNPVINSLTDNVHRFQLDAKKAENTNLNILHLNVVGFENQHLDSADLEAVFEIYQRTVGSENPVTFHCTDGLDRAGGFVLAFNLMRNYESIFNPLSSEQTVRNIELLHRKMQENRGGFFCTASSHRLAGAVQLATIMKSIEISNNILNRLEKSDPNLYSVLRSKDYVEQIKVLRDQKDLPRDGKELLVVLEARARTELHYFKLVAENASHPLIEKFLMLEIEKENPNLHIELEKGKNYVEKVEILLNQKKLTPHAETLLDMLISLGRGVDEKEKMREKQVNSEKSVLYERFDKLLPRIQERENSKANALWNEIQVELHALGELSDEVRYEEARIREVLGRSKGQTGKYLDSISKLQVLVEKHPRIREIAAKECLDNIEKMLLEGRNLDPLMKRRGQESRQQEFLADYNGIKAEISAGKNPAQFLTKLIVLKAQLEATKPNKIQAAQYKKYVTSDTESVAKAAEVPPDAKAPAASWATSAQGQQAAKQSAITFSRAAKKESPKADAASPIQNISGTLTAAMLRSSQRNSVSEEQVLADLSKQGAALGQQVKGLKVLSESGPQAFAVTMNKVEGDFNRVVNDAKEAATKSDVVYEFDGNCVIKTQDACIHLSRADNGETKLAVHCEENKQEKAFEAAARIVHGLGNQDCHQAGSLKDNTANKDVQSKVEQIHAQRDANLKY